MSGGRPWEGQGGPLKIAQAYERFAAAGAGANDHDKKAGSAAEAAAAAAQAQADERYMLCMQDLKRFLQLELREEAQEGRVAAAGRLQPRLAATSQEE